MAHTDEFPKECRLQYDIFTNTGDFLTFHTNVMKCMANHFQLKPGFHIIVTVSDMSPIEPFLRVFPYNCNSVSIL